MGVGVLVVTLLFVMLSLFRKSRYYKALAQNFVENGTVTRVGARSSLFQDYLVESPGYKLVPRASCSVVRNFERSVDHMTLADLHEALVQLKRYRHRALENNHVLLARSMRMDAVQREQLRQIGYFAKIQHVERRINGNSDVVAEIIRTTLERLFEDNDDDAGIVEKMCEDLGYERDVETGVLLSSRGTEEEEDRYSCVSLTRMNEALSHLCRDWSPAFANETGPLLEYITARIDTIGTNARHDRTLFIIPGPGVGYIPYSLASLYPHATVDSIEWSSLMYVCNQFALHYDKGVDIAPFAPFYSNQECEQTQLRSFAAPLREHQAVSNLNTLWGDFRNYLPQVKDHDTVVVVSAYFLDTAESVFEYVERIETLKCVFGSDTRLHWINIGPLKYGTRPLVQFTAEEMRRLRRVRGWEDLHEDVTVKGNSGADPQYPDGLNAYLTDRSSLYQGYYGLLRFHSTFHPDRIEH